MSEYLADEPLEDDDMHQTRGEHSRSLEDAEKFKAIETLTELGVLIPVSELETVHGRVAIGEATVRWSVDPSFANGGNGNVNHRATLYTSDHDTAKRFAEHRLTEQHYGEYRKGFEQQVMAYTPRQRKSWARSTNKNEQQRWESLTDEQRQHYPEPEVVGPESLDEPIRISGEARRLERTASDKAKTKAWARAGEQLRTELHTIVSDDPDARILDLTFDVAELDDKQQQRYRQALHTLAPLPSEGSPLHFDDKSAARAFIRELNDLGKPVLSEDDIHAIAQAPGMNQRSATQLGSSYNAQKIITSAPGNAIGDMLDSDQDIFSSKLKVNGEVISVPLSAEYVQYFMRQAHIVGVRNSVNSVTINRDGIHTVSFVDLQKTRTAESYQEERSKNAATLGGLAVSFKRGEVGVQPADRHPLTKALQNPYVKPRQLIELAATVDGYEHTFEADAGNWEGYTLGEHTETVLRNFDENYADKVPVDMLAPMRLAILGHDLGKPAAAANNEKYKQTEYNVEYAQDFYSKLGLESRLQDLLVAMIGKGEELAFQTTIRKGGEPAERAMQAFARETLKVYFDNDTVEQSQVDGLVEMCTMLQVCDGGAYTSMAVTRPAKGGAMYRNASSFDASFRQPVGFGGRDIAPR